MEDKEEVVNINFFKKVWYSITKFERYPAMATEGLARAIKYLIMLTIIVTIFGMIGSILQMNKLVGNLAQYIEQNVPDFTFEDGKITAQMEQPMIIEDVKYNGIDKIIINPLMETDEQKEQSERDETVEGTTIFFFKDEIVLKNKTSDGKTAKQEYTYSDFIASYTGENISTFNKTELVEYLKSQRMAPFYARYGASIFLYLLILNIIYGLLDSLEIAMLGWLTASLAKIRMRFVAIYNMAVYSLTLPMILNMLYLTINYFTTFTITYFQVAYITIAYVYLAASIFIIKDDFIKKMQEVARIKQEQKKVKEEIKEQEEKQKEPKDEDKEDNKGKEDKNKEEEGEEPQGSEA